MLKNGHVSEFNTRNLVIHQHASLTRLLLVTKLFGIVHNSCRLKLGTNIDVFGQRYGIKHEVDESAAESEFRKHVQSMVHSKKNKSILFEFKIMTNKRASLKEKKDTDSLPHNEGDLGKCSVESEEKRLTKEKKIYPKDENH